MISAIVPVYNCRPWIEEALRSLLDQTVPVDEILVADDASTDGTADHIESLALPRTRVLRSEANQGISRQLNRLVAEARGRYVMRMDGDDISLPGRLERQMEIMREGGHGVVGTACRRFGEADTLHRFYTRDSELKAGLLFSVPFCHPTVLFDRDRLGDALRYDPEFDLAEDYHLWVGLRGTATYANAPEDLFRWRMHRRNAGTGATTAPVQQKLSSSIRSGLIADYGLHVPPELFQAFDDRALGRVPDFHGLERYLRFLEAFRAIAPSTIGSDRDSLDRILADQWDLACHFAAWKHRRVPLLWRTGCSRLGLPWARRTAASLVAKSLLGIVRK